MEIIRTGGETNTYILTEGNKCLLIDPACRISRLEEKIADREVLAVLLTHGHYDHIRTVDEIFKKYNCPVYLHEDDEEMVRPGKQLENYRFNALSHISSPISHLREGRMEIGPFVFEVLFTPGHSQGSVCYLFDKELFCGDTLFRMSCGRTDLPGGNMRMMRDSLRQLAALDPEITIYPGHEAASSIGFELANNPYLG